MLDIYKASAGSGKTFLLAIQYLRLLFEYPKNYRSILAVTFTNKATAEMKERILGELEHLARGQETLNGRPNIYAQRLLQEMPNMDFDELHQQAKKIYSAILHDYSQFSVTTIDSFVQRIIRSFAYEIGLDAGFQLQLNTDMVKEDLANRLFKLLDEDGPLRNWVTDMAMDRLADGKAWNFRQDMVNLSGELFKERFQAFETALKTIPDVHLAFTSMQTKVFSATRHFEEKWKEFCDQGSQLLQANGLSAEDFPYKDKGFAAIYRKPLAALSKDGLSNRVLDVVEGNAQLYGKSTAAATKARILAAENAITAQLKQMVLFFTEGIVKYKTALAIGRNLRTLRLMQVFSQQLANYRSDNNMLLISDTHLLLRQLTQDTDASFIYEKTGNHYKHYLIDEFQDTSGFQWDNFKPLLENTLAEGKYSLIVGDVKQAIYRWRNGDWRLLLEQVGAQLASFQPQNHTLQDNRRSARPIIHFNNYLYNVAPRLLQQELTNAIAAAPENVRHKLVANGFDKIIEKAYESSYQHIPDNAPDDGLVDIQFLDLKNEEGEKLPYDELVLPKVHETICSLLSQGYQAADIGILTRKNSEARAIIEYLMEAQQEEGSAKYNLLSAEALLLQNNEGVGIVISALKWLASPNKLSLVELRQKLAAYQQLAASQYDIFIRMQEEEHILPPAFTNATARLRQLALPEMVNAIIGIFQLQEKNSNAAYLLALQDVVGEWGRFGEDGLLSFLQYWEEEREKKSLPAASNKDAVEVLTVHKSKGLAFTILLIPYLNWRIKPDATKGIQLWVDTRATPFAAVPVVPVRYSGDLQQTDFAYDYFEEYLLGVMDSLNMLYVATTRARSRILGWAPKPDKIDEITTIERLLYKMAQEKHEGNNLTIMPVYEGFEDTTLQWKYGKDDFSPVRKEIAPPTLLPPLVQANWKQRLAIRYKPLQTAQAMTMQLPRQQGILLHEALAKLWHPSQLDGSIRQMELNGLMTDSQLKAVKKQLQKILAHPLLEGWHNHSMQRLGEREIITPGRQLRRPDLVLYSPTSTLVIDFKFTGSKTDFVAHQAQVREYMGLMDQLGFADVRGYLLYTPGDEVEIVAA